jgi:hypothetical protein
VTGEIHHENLRDGSTVKAPSEKSFGVTFACVFGLLSGWQFYSHGVSFWAVATILAGIGFLGMAFAAPAVLRPLNLLWMKFGLLLHRIVNPLIMGVLFFGVFTPMGLAMRLFGADLLRLRAKPAENGYWIIRANENVGKSSMTNQF